MTRIALLGPQRHQPNVGEIAVSLGVKGRLAVITAGWQEREAEIEELDAILEHPAVNLKLHQRAERIFLGEPSFREAHRAHQNHIKKLQGLYRIRLGHLMNAVRDLLDRRDEHKEDPLIEGEIRAAMRSVTKLDRFHISRLRQLHHDFQEKWTLGHASLLMDHHYELADILRDCDGVLIAGGHVAVLLNRLRLLKMASLIRGKTIIAWSAGAMALGEKIVLFHDTPPQGSGYAEVFEAGLGLYPGVVPLPHAAKRLRLDDPTRVTMFAGRFPEDKCLTFDEGSSLIMEGESWRESNKVRQLKVNGKVEVMEVGF